MIGFFQVERHLIRRYVYVVVWLWAVIWFLFARYDGALVLVYGLRYP